MHTAVYQETSLETRGQGVFIVSWSHKHKLSWWCSDKEYTCRSRRHRFDPWVGKISWRKRWQSMPVFLPGKFHWERSLAGYSPRDRKRVGHDLVTKQQQHITLSARQVPKTQNFHCGPVVKTPSFPCRGVGLIPGWGTKIPHAVRHGKRI